MLAVFAVDPTPSTTRASMRALARIATQHELVLVRNNPRTEETS
jgi:hypothetical protein